MRVFRSKWCRTLFVIALLSFPAFGKFKRILVLAGGQLNTAVALGILEGLRAQGWEPDVIVTTCGSSLAGAIVNVYPTSLAQKQFLQSDAYYEVLQSVRMDAHASGYRLVLNVLDIGMNQGTHRIPNVFKRKILNVAQTFTVPDLDRDFQSAPIHLVMLGAKMNFSPQEVGNRRRGRKLFRTVYFTDSEVAPLLRGFKSPIAKLFPDSSVEEGTEVLTDQKLMMAVRASVADPYLMEPARIGDSYFAAGTVDLYPLETAKRLLDSDGGEILSTYSPPFNAIERMVMKASFGYDNKARWEQAMATRGVRWIDISDNPQVLSQVSFNPVKQGLAFHSGVPASREEFLAKIVVQWGYGKKRAIEALGTTVDDRGHVWVANPHLYCGGALKQSSLSWDLEDYLQFLLQS